MGGPSGRVRARGIFSRLIFALADIFSCLDSRVRGSLREASAGGGEAEQEEREDEEHHREGAHRRVLRKEEGQGGKAAAAHVQVENRHVRMRVHTAVARPSCKPANTCQHLAGAHECA